MILRTLEKIFEGDIRKDVLHQSIYATDASVYRKLPLFVAYPKNKKDLKNLIQFALENNTHLICRTAGTSLAGQCVGDGIIVDMSKYFTDIFDLDLKNKTITVAPGIIRDDLNHFLKPHNLFFAPNTSTSNRCMIGGMVGNNASGTTSIQYGTTRDKIIALECILSDGSEVIFENLSVSEFIKKTKGNILENKIYAFIYEKFSQEKIQKNIVKHFPKKEIHRRNTGYAMDILLDFELFGGNQKMINLSKLLSGSEGTLAIITKIKLQLDICPPKNKTMICAHFKSIEESLRAVKIAMQHNLQTCELMDKTILDCTKNNHLQKENRFFLKGDPQAILMLELANQSFKKLEKETKALIGHLKKENLGYHFTKVFGEDITKVLALRKAGLGVLGGMIGDKKAVACVEDTAVSLEDLPKYIADFSKMMEKFGQKSVYYAHAGAGELHLRPILNLKKQKDVDLFKKITYETAKIVKKYKGSFSGEHGDGIVRSESIPLMIGKKNYELIGKIKNTFDSKNIFNQGKIFEALPMDKNFRYETNRKEPYFKTFLDFSDNKGIVRFAEKCNGSGDCRKSLKSGGVMCPSYRATQNEKDSTRARANALREFLTNSPKKNKFNHKELYEVFELCLSCKACSSECPSNVDISTLKSEFLYQYQKNNCIPLKNKIFAYNSLINKYLSKMPHITNFILKQKFTKKIMGIAPERTLPILQKTTLQKWYLKNKDFLHKGEKPLGNVFVFCDEFTNYYEVDIGIDTLELLSKLGYAPFILNNSESGRSAISKGFLKFAQKKADENIRIFKDLIDEKTPLLGIEPSAILSFRDEYLRLATDKKAAQKIAKHTFTIEEFLQKEIIKNKIPKNLFTKKSKNIKVHLHCHQKALSNLKATFEVLNLPENYCVSILNSGCCGMAGAFGYEKKYYHLSQKIYEQNLFSKIKNTHKNTLLVATGTSCRHQIKDSKFPQKPLHPVSVLKNALLG